MAQLWGGRFTKPTDEKVYAFNASIGFDKDLRDLFWIYLIVFKCFFPRNRDIENSLQLINA